jgi:chromosome segregation ATPase
MKKILIIGLIVVAGVFLLRKTSVCSYAGTLWSRVRTETKNQVPIKFELDRIRHEIASMDADIRNMLSPIAENMAAVKRLKRDIETTRSRLAEQKDSLLTMTKDLDGNPRFITYGSEQYSAERIRQKLDRDFASYKRCESKLKSQETLLDAKERSLSATREQLNKVITKRREFEVRLAQLEADEETLQIARIGSRGIQLDDSRATEIEAALAEIERRHDVQREELELMNGPLASDIIPVQENVRPPVDVNAVRNYLQGNGAAPSSTAVSRK